MSAPRHSEMADQASARLSAAHALCRALSGHANIGAGEVFRALEGVPDNLLFLLDSPDGWTALAEYLGANLGKPSMQYRPTVH